MRQQWLFSDMWHLISMLSDLPERKFNIELQDKNECLDDNKRAMKTTMLLPTQYDDTTHNSASAGSIVTPGIATVALHLLLP